MSIGKSLIPEFDQEMANTRNALERIPEGQLDWKPDPKSMALGRLAGHIAEMVGWAATTLKTDSLDIMPGGDRDAYKALIATSREQLVAELDKNISEARAALGEVSDAEMMNTWKLLANGQVMIEMPKIAVIRGMVMNHIIHHRGQLMVYYRLTGVPVPGMYGPSADEGQAAMA